jgi:hypothetical protein
LYQLGTDQLENLFSVIRTITHSSTCDFLELNDRLKMAYQVEQVYNDRPDWRPNNRLSTKTKITTILDHSSVHSWTGDLSTINLGLETIWEIGCENAKAILKEFGFSDDEFCLNYDVTTLNPMNVQLNDDNDEEEADNEYTQCNLANEEIETALDDDENEALDEVEEFNQMVESESLPFAKVLLDGVEVHKSRAINLLVNCPHRQSRDRTTREYSSLKT